MSRYDIDSMIRMDEVVENKDHRFGQTTQYYPALIQMEDGKEVPALFTRHQIMEAIERAKANPEDLPETKSLWEVIFG
jgi:hypothetical protein